jgi:hypothetical protein
MPELIVYDSRGYRLHVNSAVHYRGMRAVVTQLITPNTVKIKMGGIVQTVYANRVRLMT